ncbi:outer membrane porin GjpA [Mycobacterium sp. TY814]|uniref:outer membrane porin GjpA n=1 Tax=unclassified Mycobacterium TaxID=2642494 RepID=UPI002741EF4A|nr:outer membrane porin GjpA [Mycobacterium sp. TY814]MDP7723711.1 outer membrane porin GjpA [Mycobacterium sp. TY814]
MSSVIATPELVLGAAENLAAIRSSLDGVADVISGPTIGIAAAAQDEISTALATMFSDFGRDFRAIDAQAEAFHARFVQLVSASAVDYADAEIANAAQLLSGPVSLHTPGGALAAASDIDPLSRWTQVLGTTTRNAQSALGAFQAGVSTLFGGVSTGLRQLATNPAAFFGNIQTAAQSVFLVGAPQDVASAVVQHTLGGITQATNPGAVPPAPTVVPLNDVHVELYTGLAGLGDFQTGTSSLETALVAGLTNFAASPASGVLLGAVGPFVSPAVALWNSAGSVFADLTGGSPTAALGHLLDTPANVVDAFFNGATLNLDALAPAVNPFVTSGSAGGEQLDGVSLAFGGLFSPGQVVSGASGPMYYGTGGSLLNAVGLELSFYPPDDFAGGSLSIPAIPVGPIGATAGLISILGQALGGTLLAP